MDDQAFFDAATAGDVSTIAAALERWPEKLYVRDQPYGWTMLHHAAHQGRLPVVNLLLDRGFDVNTREHGDNTSALNWAAAAGHVNVVRRLLDAGVDPVGQGDDHGLEAIGWASCWDGCDDDAHREIQRLLIERGARHHIFSAIAIDSASEVRRIVSADPSSLSRTMSRNEAFRRPLHAAVNWNKPGMVALLIELGADPMGQDGDGFIAAAYATTPDADRPALEAMRDRGRMDLFTALALGELTAAEAMIRADPAAMSRGGVLHLLAKRGQAAAVRWLLAHGADPNARWAHWDAEVTALHLAVLANHPEVARVLLDGGADPSIKDSKHDSDARGWAEFFQRAEMMQILKPD
jgi:ankyrin repeat protein